MTAAGDILYIPTIHEALNDYRFMIFQYDMNTGEASLFRDYADYPVPYNNGIVYYHDNGFYYHGETSDIKGKGVFYEGDELLFNSGFVGIHEDIVSDFGLETLLYCCADETENAISAGVDLGVLDKDFNKELIAHTKKGTWTMMLGDISTSGLVSVIAPIGIIKSWGIITQAVGLASRELKGKTSAAKEVRWQTDISMKHIVFFIALALVAVLLFFWFGVIHTFWQALVAFAVVVVIAFLFTTVAANAIAIVGSNPVSGMTLMTIIIASAIFVGIGLNGTSGIVASMVIGGVVCTALSMAGGFVTDLKIGYWLGSTPKKQESWKFLGTLVSAATVGGVIMVLNQVYGFTGDNALVAPQANAMAKVIEPLMMGGDTPWILYMVGAILACILNWLGVPALAFCLGMFIPLSLNTPMLVGGAIAYYVSNSSKDQKVNDARRDRGTLLSSGLIAGGALFGVFAAITRFCGFEYENPLGMETTQILGCVAYAALICYLIWDSCRAKPLR